MNPKFRRILSIFLVIAFLVAAVISVVLARHPQISANDIVLGRTSASVGSKAPNFELSSLTLGFKKIDLNLFENEPVIISFMASWCQPCRSELRLIENYYRANSDRVGIIGIDSGDSRSSAEALIKSFGLTFPVGFDPSLYAANSLYLINAFPTSFLVSADRRILAEQEGLLNEEILNSWQVLLRKS